MLQTPIRIVGVAILMLCFTSFSVPAEPVKEELDMVIFNNGDRISGQLRSADSGTVHLKSAALGDLTIQWTDIAEVQAQNRRWKIETQGMERRSEFVDFRRVTLRSTTSGVVVNVDSQAVTVPNGSSVLFVQQEHRAAGMTQLMNAKEPAFPPSSSVAIGLNAPESVVLGSTSQEVFGGSLRVFQNQPDLCATPSWASSLLSAVNHNKSYKVGMPAVVTDTFDGTVSLKNRLGSESSVAGLLVADFFGNSSLGIGLQQSYGVGISRVLYSNECREKKPVIPAGHQLTVSGDASVRYIHQRLYAPGGSEDLAGVRLNESLVYVLLLTDRSSVRKELFSIDQSLWVTPMLNDARAVQAGGSLGISFPLGKSLSLSVTGEDDFFNNAPKAKRKNFVKSAVTVTYTFPPPQK
jgi:hypothetical protein